MQCYRCKRDRPSDVLWHEEWGGTKARCRGGAEEECLRLEKNAILAPAVGVKHDSKKPRPSLISPAFLLEIGAVLEHGASKYSEGNWVLVDKARYLDAAFRHWLQYLTGEKLDKDSGFSHLAHLGANLSILFEKDRNEAK